MPSATIHAAQAPRHSSLKPVARSHAKPTVIDLFCGCGGLSYGFMEQGYDVVLGIDNWKEALDTFALNHKGAKTHLADLAQIHPSDIATEYGLRPGDIDLIIGGPPCQGFSIAGKRDVTDPRNTLFTSFVAFVDFFRPKAFVLENVPNLVSMAAGSVKDRIVSDFEALGYRVNHQIMLASHFGVPQNRKRVFFVGLRDGSEFAFPTPTHGIGALPMVSSKEALADLPEHGLDNGSRYTSKALTPYQEAMRKDSIGIFNHDITKHTDETKRIIAMVPDGKNYLALPKSLRATRKVNIAWTRLCSTKPSFTIDTGHFHHFHYSYNRVPTARESARLQSFPDKFVFLGNKTSKLRQVGNAVPPMLGSVLASALLPYVQPHA